MSASREAWRSPRARDLPRRQLERLPGIEALLDTFRDWKRGSPAESV